MGPHPRNVVLLCCDAFGVLPPVSKLSLEQVMYHFISGYTSKVRHSDCVTDCVTDCTVTCGIGSSPATLDWLGYSCGTHSL